MDAADRAALRTALAARFDWLADPQHGPQTVEAGECDSCGAEARLVMTCGPGPVYLGRRCAAERGATAWCDGHVDDAHAALAWLEMLPAEADTAARLWWVATGEVRLPADVVARLRRALPDQR